MLEVLAELPILSQHAPDLRSKLQEELDVSCFVREGCIRLHTAQSLICPLHTDAMVKWGVLFGC